MNGTYVIIGAFAGGLLAALGVFLGNWLYERQFGKNADRLNRIKEINERLDLLEAERARKEQDA